MDHAPNPVVHLELHTNDLECAKRFVSRLLHWRPAGVEMPSGRYEALEVGGAVGGGIVDCGSRPALWLPYVEVDEVDESTSRAVELGATVLLAPREGPAGWRSVISTPRLASWRSGSKRNGTEDV